MPTQRDDLTDNTTSTTAAATTATTTQTTMQAAADSKTSLEDAATPHQPPTPYRRVVPSTIRMNPYVRCVRGGADAVPEVRSLSDLLVAANGIAAADMDTPCLRPACAPSPVARSFAAGAGGVVAPKLRGTSASGTSEDANQQDKLRGGNTGRAGQTRGGTQGASMGPASPPLHFTHEGVATPNSFASVRKLERWVRQQQEAHSAKTNVPHIAVGGPLDPLSMCLPASTGGGEDDDDDDDDDEPPRRAGITSPFPAEPTAAVDQIHLPRTDVEETMPNNRIVSPRSSTRVEEAETACTAGKSPTENVKPCAVSTPTSTTAASLPGKKSSTHRTRTTSTSSSSPSQRVFPAVPHPASLAPAAKKMEGSPYHYLMRNYVGGTFLYYAHPESKKYFLDLCYRIVDQVRPILEQETLFPQCGLFPRLSAPAFVLGDIHGNFEDLSYFLQRLLVFHDFNLTPSNLLCLGDYVDRGPFSLECVMLLLSLKIMNASKIVMLRGNHEDRVVCGDLQTYGRGCFLAQCHAVFGYEEGMRLFRAVTSLFRYLPLAAELVIPSAPNASYLRARSQFASFNVYGTETSHAVPIHGTPAILTPTTAAPDFTGGVHAQPHSATLNATSATTCATTAQLRFPSGLEATAVGIESGHTSPRCACTPLPAREAGDTNPYSTILVANTSLGQPTREEAHEERILCTHGGIPRFFCPPREDGALDYLRSLRFPRLLTLFPNNPIAMADEECAPEYYFDTLLPRLVRQFPKLARMGLAELDDGASTTASEESPSHTTNAQSRPATTATTSPTTMAGETDSHKELSDRESPDRVLTPSTRTISETQEVTVAPAPVVVASLPSELVAATAAATATATELTSPARVAPPPPRMTDLAAAEALLAKLTYSNDDLRRSWFITFDLLWSDPTPTEPESSDTPGSHDRIVTGLSAASNSSNNNTRVNEWGFGINTRGSHVVSFTARAVEWFLSDYNYAMLFRAHQEKTHGLRWCKSNKVLTVFSSSNYLGHGNGAGCVVLSVNGEVQMIEKMGMPLGY